jgi:undecaprenyl-diphosphatase
MGGEITYQTESLFPLLIGFIAAFITGIIACTWMITLVKKSKLKYFATYCFLVGIVAISIVLLY